MKQNRTIYKVGKPKKEVGVGILAVRLAQNCRAQFTQFVDTFHFSCQAWNIRIAQRPRAK